MDLGYRAYAILQIIHITQKPAQCIDERTITYWFSKSEIVKITDAGNFANDSWDNEYYFNNKKVLFVLEKSESGPVSGPLEKSESQFYIKNDQIIRCISDKKIISKTSARVVSFAYRILDSYITRKYPSVQCQ